MLTEEEIYERMIALGISYVSIRPRSKKELLEYFTKKCTQFHGTLEIVDRVMERMAELSYVDDMAFATWLKESRQRTKPKGKKMIQRELAAKGISKDIINALFPVGGDGVQEDELAKKALANKWTQWSLLPPLVQKQRVYGYLGRRGFASAVIYRVIDELTKKHYNSE